MEAVMFDGDGEDPRSDRLFHVVINALLGLLTTVSTTGVVALWTQSNESAKQIIRLQEQIAVVKSNSEVTANLIPVVSTLEVRVGKLERDVEELKKRHSNIN